MIRVVYECERLVQVMLQRFTSQMQTHDLCQWCSRHVSFVLTLCSIVQLLLPHNQVVESARLREAFRALHNCACLILHDCDTSTAGHLGQGYEGELQHAGHAGRGELCIREYLFGVCEAVNRHCWRHCHKAR